MADLVKLKDDGEADFAITDKASGSPVSYDDAAEVAAYDGDREANARYRFRCCKCGSEDCRITDGRQRGSSWTGMYGSMDLECKDCGASRVILDT